MAAIFETTRFTTCIPAEVGGSGNPSTATARGVVCGIEAALMHLGIGEVSGKVIAVQGLGHVATPMIRQLLGQGAAKIIATDIDPGRVEAVQRELGDRIEARVVERGDNSVLAEKCDVLAPCAIGGVLSKETIPTIEAPIVCGAANNQLHDPLRDDRRLRDAGVLFMPDFLVNRMGIVQCADEQYGYAPNDSKLERHLGREWAGSIYNLSLRLLKDAEEASQTPAELARRLADQQSRQLHPIWGHRSAEIIAGLARGDWSEQRTVVH